MPSDFYIDNQLYLEFLEITQSEIPSKNNLVDKQELFKIIEQQFRKLARKYHPDYGGTEDNFKFLLHCKNKLLSEETSEANLALQFDESKFLSFDSKSLASKLGNQLFELISSWKEELNIKPIFKPTTSADEYEWIFNILNSDIQLSLNVQNLSKELAQLSHELYEDNSLSVLVCLFIPSKKFAMTKIAYDNSIQLTFNDKILIESSNASDISNYFANSDRIIIDLEAIKSGTFISKTNELKTKASKEAISADKEVLEYLQNIKLFSGEYNEKAADFLDKL